MEDVQSDQSEDDTLPNLPDTDNPDKAYYSDTLANNKHFYQYVKLTISRLVNFIQDWDFIPEDWAKIDKDPDYIPKVWKFIVKDWDI